MNDPQQPTTPTTPMAPTSPTSTTSRRGIGRFWWLIGLAIAAVIVVVLAPLASSDPDGLERVAGDQGFLGNALGALYELLPNYTIPGLDGNASTILAGLVGIVIVFLVMVGLGRVLARRRR